MFFTDTLRHRETARKIVENIPKETSDVTIDFVKIDFASRSFLHELLSNLCNRKVKFTNANQEIRMMTDVILKSSKLNLEVQTQDNKLLIKCS